MNNAQVRIIGGQWRSRKILFPDNQGLRPTPDRVRETLFNWIASELIEARCLDLFAGSGALGLEALSRGASACMAVENDPKVVNALQKNAAQLKAETFSVVQADVLQWLQSTPVPFDIIFADPPYQKSLLTPTLSLLEARGWLNPGALIYVESDQTQEIDALPSTWTLLKSKKAGRVHYALARKTG